MLVETAISSLMENLKQLLNSKVDFFLTKKRSYLIESIYKDLGLLKAFFEDQDQEFHKNETVKNLKRRIRDVMYEAENTIDLYVYNAILGKEKSKEEEEKKKKTNEKRKNNKKKKKKKKEKEKKKKKNQKKKMEEDEEEDVSLNVECVKQKINTIKREVMEIHEKQICTMRGLEVGNSSKDSIPKWEKETMVRLVDETRIILEQLFGERKQLEVISIVGMAGIGKTTLARRVYSDPLVEYRFRIRGWAYVSQEFNRKDFLLRLLSSLGQDAEGIQQMTENDLAGRLYKGLKGKVYFIVMDDIWDSKAWIDLMNCFPNDNNGSRILFTSRLADVALHANPSRLPLFLRFLTHVESWELLQIKVFGIEETCPSELMEIGKQISQKCQGLPLAIVLVAGILARKEKRVNCWNQVRETMNSWIGRDPRLWMKTLALSYYHLPHHLRPCFLYLGAFREDFEIRVSRLIRLWVAEGFIHEMEEKSLEDVAEEYLMDLIRRSLVLVLRRGFNGAIKACGIHDLVHDFCRRKAKEDCFLVNVSNPHVDYLPFTPKHQFLGARRLSIDISNSESIFLIPPSLNVRSFLCTWSRIRNDIAPIEFISKSFKLVKVLEMSSIKFNKYPNVVEQLLLLKYLSFSLLVYSRKENIPNSICDLHYLETLTIYITTYWSSDGPWVVGLSRFTRKMESLRHLRLIGPMICKIEQPVSPVHFLLENLQTLSMVDPWSWKDLLTGAPHLRKLGFRGDMLQNECLTIPDLAFLKHLQELKLSNTQFSWLSHKLGCFQFPPNLKKLTLEETYLKWEEVSCLAELVPNLESLKLLSEACTEDQWEVNTVFQKLKFLKLSFLDIEDWVVRDYQFPSLQHLALDGCFSLNGLPYEIGDIMTLEMIEVNWCDLCVENSVKQIVDDQKNMGKTILCNLLDP
ncbi:putative late blight resistance protein homolog R1A-10 [Diospyros lotus]|uniref:putative late blight resistance protein homolog R1A-10 n=1 Tax=Diospyros lotus TaxID=55363 RepID=UPI00225A20AC|nr:putative late blight resistance protein homolog R1A-10 [Diospyros lotus]